MSSSMSSTRLVTAGTVDCTNNDEIAVDTGRTLVVGGSELCKCRRCSKQRTSRIGPKLARNQMQTLCIVKHLHANELNDWGN